MKRAKRPTIVPIGNRERRFRENNAIRQLFEHILITDKRFKHEIAELRADLAEQFYNMSEPIPK